MKDIDIAYEVTGNIEENPGLFADVHCSDMSKDVIEDEEGNKNILLVLHQRRKIKGYILLDPQDAKKVASWLLDYVDKYG